MKKATLIFPSYDAMWLFKDQTKAINIQIKPKSYLISGLFDPKEIELAVLRFNADWQNKEIERK